MHMTIGRQRWQSVLVVAALASIHGVVTPAAAQSEGSFFRFVSEPGDFIGQGESRSFTPEESSTFSAMATSDGGAFALTIFPLAGGFWFVNMAAPLGQKLVPGVYEGATRFASADGAGLDVSGDGRGCNMLTGRFEVQEATYGPLGYVERFRATFQQHCEGAPPALFGEVQILNPPPPPALTIVLAVDRHGTVKRRIGTAMLRGTIACSAPTTVTLFGTLAQHVSRFALASASFGASVDCVDGEVEWSVEVSPDQCQLVTTSSASGRQQSVNRNPAGPFGPGPAQFDVTATAFDPNFGAVVTVRETGLIHLRRARHLDDERVR